MRRNLADCNRLWLCHDQHTTGLARQIRSALSMDGAAFDLNFDRAGAREIMSSKGRFGSFTSSSQCAPPEPRAETFLTASACLGAAGHRIIGVAHLRACVPARMGGAKRYPSTSSLKVMGIANPSYELTFDGVSGAGFSEKSQNRFALSIHAISDFQKLSLTPDPNHLLNLRIPSRERGRWPSSLTLGRGAVDADALLTKGA